MGQIGFDILENDEALDIHYLYFEKYNTGKTTMEIERWFKSHYADYFNGKVTEDNSNFWLGFAMAQWETKALSPIVLKKVEEIISLDIESEVWEEDFPRRKKHLEDFLKKISKEKKTAKKPVKQRLFRAPFKKGDVITSRINDGDKWGVMVCLANSEGLQKMGECLFATTTIELDKPATMEDLKDARINNESGDDQFCSEIRGCGISSTSVELGEFDEIDKLKKIGGVNIEKTFNMNIYPFGDWCNCLELKYSSTDAITLDALISKPNHKYTSLAEFIVSNYGLSSEEQKDKNGDEYRKMTDIIDELKYDNEEEYENEFIPFMIEYTRNNEVEDLIE